MNMVEVCEKTITYGKQRYRVNSLGEWSTLMWGWWPDGGDYPSYRMVAIDKKKVPKEVLAKGAI